jgi:cytochrome P450 / NADPH-cytochrome P450 reductase
LNIRLVLEERRKNGSRKKDILDTMINGKDPKTGKGLPDSNILANMLTFLIAGHETTSGLLSFMTYYLLKNPETMRKLRAEVDGVLQGRPLQVSDLSKLPYLIGKSFLD